MLPNRDRQGAATECPGGLDLEYRGAVAEAVLMDAQSCPSAPASGSTWACAPETSGGGRLSTGRKRRPPPRWAADRDRADCRCSCCCRRGPPNGPADCRRHRAWLLQLLQKIAEHLHVIFVDERKACPCWRARWSGAMRRGIRRARRWPGYVAPLVSRAYIMVEMRVISARQASTSKSNISLM